MTRVYISGAMSGRKDHNFPAFYRAARLWRSLGFEVVNPAEMDESEDHEALAKAPWDYYLRRDLRALTRCDAIAMLPGWRRSHGARLEHHVARQLHMDVYEADQPPEVTEE